MLNCGSGLRPTKLLGLFALTVASLVACGPDPVDPKSPEQILLDHAIEALWGQVDPASVQSLRTRSVMVEKNDGFSSTFELETLLASNGRYRESRLWRDFGLEEVFASSGEKSWYLVDGTLVADVAEEEKGPGRDQAWLFEISKLAGLKDGKRFQLEHEGPQELEDGTKVQRLRVKDRERGDLDLALDIAESDWLVHRVVLDDRRDKHSFSLLLEDYRPVAGIQFAHGIISRLDGKPFARQTMQVIEVNPKLTAADFEPPAADQEAVVLDKDSIGGSFAWSRLEDDEVAAGLPALKEWIAAHGFEVAGPLVVLGNLSEAGVGEVDGARLALAIKRPDPETRAALPADEAFGLIDLAPRPALCLTVVGPEALEAGRKRLEEAAKAKGLAARTAVIEVFYARDGRIRQLQVPVD
ncbi:MAG: hypothetical protein H6807_13475 [Planctomycetes bacterium]|nr:hypothetical protein [Planctomycetota bacterium]